MEKINWEEISMNIISNVGMAKSNAIMAIDCMENNNFSEAESLLKEAEQFMVIAEKAHMDVIVQEAQGIQHDFKVLFMHAEDQMLSAQTLILIAQKFCILYKKLAT